jgi:hypothetical protein
VINAMKTKFAAVREWQKKEAEAKKSGLVNAAGKPLTKENSGPSIVKPNGAAP